MPTKRKHLSLDVEDVEASSAALGERDGPTSQRTPRATWTEEEDNLITSLVGLHGGCKAILV
jgi:hypothetical protein